MLLGSSRTARAGSGTRAQGQERVTDTCSCPSDCDAGLPPQHPCPGPLRPACLEPSSRPLARATAALATPSLCGPPSNATHHPHPVSWPSWGREAGRADQSPGTSPSPQALHGPDRKCAKIRRGADRTQRRGHSGQDQNLEREIEGVHDDGHPGQDLWGGCRGNGSRSRPSPVTPLGVWLCRGPQDTCSRAGHRPDPSVRDARGVRAARGGSPGWWPLDQGLPGSGDTPKSDARPVPPLPAVLPCPGPQFPQWDKGLCLRALRL